jgi:AcrR family transcriptional regulator
MSGRARGRPSSTDPTVPTALLLDRALDMFAESGYEGMSVRELARELGVSHNLIPQRIGSKEQLWFAAINRGFGSLALELAQAIAEHDEEADDLARLRVLLVRWVEANTARPALLRIINQEATAPGPRLDYLFDRYIAPVREFGDDLLSRLAKDGKVRTSSAPLMYFMMTHGAGGPFILPALAEKFGTPLDASDAVAVHDHAMAVADLIFDGLVIN